MLIVLLLICNKRNKQNYAIVKSIVKQNVIIIILTRKARLGQIDRVIKLNKEWKGFVIR